MRKVSEQVKQLLDQGYAETTDVVQIEIPPSEAFPDGETLYLASRSGLIIDGQRYSNHLRALGTIKFSLGQAPDTASFAIENVSLTFSALVSDTSNYIEGSSATISRVFTLPSGDYEVVELFDGNLNGLRFDQEKITINLISRMSLRTSQMARRPVTQRCIWRFKSAECGWKEGLGGDDGKNPESVKAKYCDRGWDTKNGCLAHGNIHRFGGVPQFSGFTGLEVSNSNGYDSNPAGQFGIGPGGSWCVSPESYVLVDFNGPIWRMAAHLEEGDIIYGVDKYGKLVKRGISKVTDGSATSMYTITTSAGLQLTCSPSHPIIRDIGDSKGISASAVRPEDKILTYNHSSGEVLEDSIASIEIYAKDSLVIMLSIDGDVNTYIAGDIKLGGIVSHNSKQIAGRPLTGKIAGIGGSL